MRPQPPPPPTPSSGNRLPAGSALAAAAEPDRSRSRHAATAVLADYQSVLQSLGTVQSVRGGAARLEGSEVDADAGAVRIDVGLAAADAQPGHAAPCPRVQVVIALDQVSWRL
jgi:hypothetical protein